MNQKYDAEIQKKKKKKMAKSKEDIKYGTAQAKLSEDEVLRVRYKAGTPLEGGKIADSDPVDLFAGAHNLSGEQRENQGAWSPNLSPSMFSPVLVT
ncbi:hypothetical protein ABFX02_08G161300 [Erythranthe guttata]